MNKRTKKLLAMMAAPPRLRRVSGLPPLSYTAKKAGFLTDYRIYGQTENGESVGDRTGNLWNENYPDIVVDTVKYISLSAENGEYTISTNMPLSGSASLFLLSGAVISGASTKDNGVWLEHNQTVTVSDNFITIGYRIYDNADPRDYSVMLNSGSTPLPYEPYGYRVPVTVSNGTDTLTTPIYLPEQIKKVGDEAEYIDYGEQRQHRVRKNLLQNTATSQEINGVTFTVNSDRSVTCNGTSTAVTFFAIPITINQGSYIVNGCPNNGSTVTYSVDLRDPSNGYVIGERDTGLGFTFTNSTDRSVYYTIRIAPGYTCDNLTFYPMIRKADIEDDTYEPYIENTDLDVTLPALPTVTGTNVLSVGTEVQPSLVEVTGRIRPVPTGGGE